MNKCLTSNIISYILTNNFKYKEFFLNNILSEKIRAQCF